MIRQGGRKVIVPMRYQCRLPGWSEVVERKYPGTYNARRDKLGEAWRQLFGYNHGLMVVESSAFTTTWTATVRTSCWNSCRRRQQRN